ncbi:MAG: hypothetical protein F9K23_08520 [Bacteroidetes bacterium]|nr:MAG: hypothetical protein F9K23_08520 [Bacteroidota bacterium]
METLLPDSEENPYHTSKLLKELLPHFRKALSGFHKVREEVLHTCRIHVLAIKDIGYNNGKAHHSKDDEYALELKAARLLRVMNSGYRWFGKKQLVLPLYDTDHNPVNLMALKVTETGLAIDTLLNKVQGTYPAVNPHAKTLHLFGELTACLAFIADGKINLDTACMFAIGAKLNPLQIGIAKPFYQNGSLVFDESISMVQKEIIINALGTVDEKQEAPALAEEETEQRTLYIVHPHKLTLEASFGGEWQVVGNLDKDLATLKVTLFYQNAHLKKFRGKLDLFDTAQVQKYSEGLSSQEFIPEELIALDLVDLTALLEAHREKQFEDYRPEGNRAKEEITPERQSHAVEVLQKNNLLETINTLLEKSGIVGEENTRLALFLIALSYKMPEPLHAVIVSVSGSGKSHLINGIAACMPTDDILQITRASAKSFFHFDEQQLVNKIMVIQDMDGMPREALYALRELISFKKLYSSLSKKDKFGNVRAEVKLVQGHFSSLAATTNPTIYFDNASRSLLFSVDESPEQTERINAYLAKLSAGKIDKEEQYLARQQIRDIVRMLQAREVINPYAEYITLPKELKDQRRLAPMFNSFIGLVANVNQYQRKSDDKNRIIAEIDDIQLAVRIFFDAIVLKADDFDNSLRQFYERLKTYLKEKQGGQQAAFTQREIRLAFGLSKAHVSRFLFELRSLEYITVTGGYKNKQYFYYLTNTDDYQQLRESIKSNLYAQIEVLRTPPRDANSFDPKESEA